MAREDVDLYNVPNTTEGIRSAILELRADFDAHDHDGFNSNILQSLTVETLNARVYSIRKRSFTDTTSGFWVGLVENVVKLNLGNGSSFLKWDGSDVSMTGAITAASGTIGGWIIGATTLSSAASGERIELDQGNTRINLINSNGDTVAIFSYSDGSSNAILLLNPINTARRALEIIIPASFVTGSESDAKAITIDNAADSISIDITDGGLVGIQIAGCDTSAIKITSASTNAATIDLTGASGDHPVIDITQSGTATNSYGIRITQGSGGLKEGIFIDGNADSNLAEGIYIDRDGNSASDVHAMKIDAANAGSGRGVGIDLSSVDSAFTFPADATDPTSGGGAATGRIPVEISGSTVYLAYY